jgi:uncharacterized protein
VNRGEKEKKPPRRSLLRGFVLKILYPFSIVIASMSKNKKEKVLGSIISLNNSLVIRERPKATRILLLLPHCLQINECDIRITHNIRNCKRCGKCGITDLIEIADTHQLNLFIATGGNLARKIVKEVRPEAIVAVACENDLSSGIADTYPLPVFGILNERPFGPCVNTKVSLEKVKEAIQLFCEG